MAQPLSPEDVARAREAGFSDNGIQWLQTVGERMVKCVKMTIDDVCPRCLKAEKDCRGYTFCPKWNKMRPCDCTDEYWDMLNEFENRSAAEK